MSLESGEPPPRRAKPKAPKPPPGAGRTTEDASAWRPSPTGGPDRPAKGLKEEAGGPTFFERVLFGAVGTSHLAKFCRQFAAYMEAGVDLLKALKNLETQFARTALGPVLGRLQLAVRRGQALSDAMAREPAAFDALFLSMIRVAEARGGVPETLRHMADHYEARLRLMRQARTALIYPAIVIAFAIAVGLLLTIVVLPKLVGILEDMVRGHGSDLPLPTRLLMGFSAFVQRMGWWLIPLALVGGSFGALWAYSRPRGKAALDELALYVPVLGLLLRKIDTTRFARTLATLLDAGVDLNTSLDLTSGVLRLVPFRRAIQRVRAAVVEGSELSEAIRATRRFPVDVVAIIDSGEETGKLPESLDKLADDYEEQVEHMVKNLGSLIQPVIFLVLGGIVLFIALAFIMAYVSIIGRLAGG